MRFVKLWAVTVLAVITVSESLPEGRYEPSARAELILRATLEEFPATETPIRELEVFNYYTVYDLDFSGDSIPGTVYVRSAPLADGTVPDRLLVAPSGDWTEYFGIRLFRDGLELGPAEFSVTFRYNSRARPRRGSETNGQVAIVGSDKGVAVGFLLSGFGGEALPPGLYQLWATVDMRDLPPRAGAFRGRAVSHGGIGLPSLHGERTQKGGLVFKVIAVGDSPELKADYLVQRFGIEQLRAGMAGVDQPPRETDESHQSVEEERAVHLRRALELAREGLALKPADERFLVALGVAHAKMGECTLAKPYLEAAGAKDPGWRSWVGYGINSEVIGCALTDVVISDAPN